MINFIERLSQKFESILGNNAGLSYMFLGALAASLSALARKFIPHVDSLQITSIQSIFAFLMNLYVVNHKKINCQEIPIKMQSIFCLRGIVGCSGQMLYYITLSMIPIQEAVTIIFSCIIWTGIIARIFLKEPYRWLDMFSAIVGMIGTILVVKPSFIFSYTEQSESLVRGRLVGLLCSLVFAGVTVILRFLKGVDIILVSNYNFFINIIFSSTLSLHTSNKMISLSDYFTIYLLAVLTYLCQICQTKGAYLEQPSKGQIINYVQIFFAYMYGIFIFNESVDLLSSIGSLLILSNCGILIYKNKQTDMQIK